MIAGHSFDQEDHREGPSKGPRAGNLTLTAYTIMIDVERVALSSDNYRLLLK